MSDLISRQWLVRCVEEGWIKFDTEKDENRFIHLVRDIAPSAQPYSEADIQKMQDLEQAEIQKAYELGREEGQKEAQPEQRWIPVSERLPEAECGESDNVLTTCAYKDAVKGYRRVETLYYNGGVWCYPTGETFEGRVKAWMPLPEPYREEGTE